MTFSIFQATALPLTLRAHVLICVTISKWPFWKVFISSVLVGVKELQLVSSLAYSHSDADVLNQSLLEANIATEVCLTVLDTLSIFIMGFKVTYITYCVFTLTVLGCKSALTWNHSSLNTLLLSVSTDPTVL